MSEVTQPTKSSIELLFEECIRSNRTALGINANVSVVAGPLRVNSTEPEAAKALAATALAGSALKQVKLCAGASTIAAASGDRAATLTSTIKTTAVLIRYVGPTQSWYRAAYQFDITGTGMTTTSVVIQPNGADGQPACAFVLCTTDNGGVGQVSAPSGVAVTWNITTNGGSAATDPSIGDKFVFDATTVTLRDFAGGLRAA